MKKYFLKYLPVSGEIKEGDSVEITSLKDYKSKTGNRIIVPKASSILLNNIAGSRTAKGHENWMNPIKMELFLCTRGIQVGDNVITCRTKDDYWRDDPIKTSYPCKGVVESQGDLPAIWNIKMEGEYILPFPKNYCIKVIGLISPEALFYVKEGMEFNEDEVQLWWYYYNIDLITDEVFAELREAQLGGGRRQTFDHQKYKPLYKIKGPCGHFH